ncbi:ribosome biogenesis regulatory protein [Culex quinquefasciatus]|uniref:Ribosome biogenesis regulatory protein n=1 Tax=Culex quinquefasciatus TaxID=7176 RepID=B0X4S9_CULQU|nr:ribosome biogenesis regulatory protein [Culex quinquefasciatus]|eukprot:XP_001864651.1 ribosome biogenesis regulatory protein [Culex quinquefasciatus]
MDIVNAVLQKQKKSPRREGLGGRGAPECGTQQGRSDICALTELVTAANVAKSSTGEFQEKLTNEGPRNRREGSKSALPGEKKRNLEIVSKVLKKKPPAAAKKHATKKVAATVGEKKAIEAKVQKSTAKIHVITLPGV